MAKAKKKAKAAKKSVKKATKPSPKKVAKGAVKSKAKAATKSKSKPKLKVKTSTVKHKPSAGTKALKVKKSVKVLNAGAPFSPLGDKVLIKKADSFEKTAGGLFIPASAQERPTEGEVIAIGPGVKSKKGFLKPLDVKVGDKVMYEKYAGMEMKFQTETFLILTESEIIGVIS